MSTNLFEIFLRPKEIPIHNRSYINDNNNSDEEDRMWAKSSSEEEALKTDTSLKKNIYI